MSVNGTLVEAKMATFTLESTQFIFKSVSFTLTTVPVPNLALTHAKRITVYESLWSKFDYSNILKYRIISK